MSVVKSRGALPKVGVLGGGSFGLGLASAATRIGRKVILCTREPSRDLPEPLRGAATSSFDALREAELIFLASPSAYVRSVASKLGAHLDGGHLLVHVSRGLADPGLTTLTQVLREVTPCRRVGALAGPLVAESLQDGAPGGAIVGTLFPEVAVAVREAIGGPSLQIEHSADVLGVELASALVGILSVAVGYAQAIGLGPSALAVMVTRAMREGAEIGASLGADRATFAGIDGNQALAWGFAAATKLAGLPIMYGSYPITPASSLLHNLSKLKHFGITTFQAEDEIAAIASAIGASFGGAIGVTGTSGPGLALKGEALGLAISTELPLVIVDVQRGGPSTGLPTKTEQSDLFIAVWGRNGDAPIPVLAAATPGDCFHLAIEAVRIATKYMTPVMLLTDGYIANGAEPWRIPSFADLEPFPVSFHTEKEGFFPFKRNEETLGRVWAVPGTEGLEHRIGGIEKSATTGHISYDPENHHAMTKLRAQKVMNVQKDVPRARVEQGESTGDLVVVGWGSTHGAISQAVAQLRDAGKRVSHVHIRNVWPLPAGLGELLKGFRHIMVPELNNGQLDKLLRAELLVDAQGFNRIAGQPFRIAELVEEIESRLNQLEGAN